MTNAEFKASLHALYGHGAVETFARATGVNRRTVSRWANGPDPVPGHAVAKLSELIGLKDGAPAADLPRDEWIVGDGSSKDIDGARAEYIVHTRFPRFIARIVDESGETPEREADTSRGPVYQIDPDTVLCEIVWIDRPPGPVELARLLDTAAIAIDAA